MGVFRVIDKRTGNEVDVYDVGYDKCGFPTFLIYEDGQWKRKSAKRFAPGANRHYGYIDTWIASTYDRLPVYDLEATTLGEMPRHIRDLGGGICYEWRGF